MMLINKESVYFGKLTPEGEREISRIYEIEVKMCTTHALVPREPTEEMIRALSCCISEFTTDAELIEGYKDMIATQESE